MLSEKELEEYRSGWKKRQRKKEKNWNKKKNRDDKRHRRLPGCLKKNMEQNS